MYTVNFIIKNNPNALTAGFKAHKNADELYRKALASAGKIEVEDDYGLKLTVDMDEVCGVTFSDYEDDTNKNMEFQFIQMKVQARFKNDPRLQMLERNVIPSLKASN